MWYLLYNVLLLAAAPAIVAILLAKPRCRRGLPQRLGLRPPAGAATEASGPVLWVHAVSLGEVVAVAPLVRALHARYPGTRFVVSTVTETGREAVEQRLAGVATHAYAPLDFPWAVTRTIDALHPAAFLFVETELWPNLLRGLAARRVPAILVNGRLSSDSFRGYRLVRPFMKQVLQAVEAALMQTDRDVGRLVALGAPADRVRRIGNLKFDQPLGPSGPDGPARESWLHAGERLIVAGSTHPGEEEALLAAYRTVVATRPGVVLLLAPRHVERASELAARVAATGLTVVRRSAMPEGSPASGPRVIVLDTRGELAGLYRHAAVAYVGGTLVPVGGHNLLEPAHWGKPVLHGPHTDHCAEIADLLGAAGGSRRVQNAQAVEAALADCLDDPALAQRMGRAALSVVEENRGAIERSVAVIEKILGR